MVEALRLSGIGTEVPDFVFSPVTDEVPPWLEGGMTVAGCPFAPITLKTYNDEQQQQLKKMINNNGTNQMATLYFLSFFDGGVVMTLVFSSFVGLS